MIIGQRDPSAMAPQDRLREIGEILAKGFLRSLLRKGLDVPTESTAPCDTVVNGEETRDSKEAT
jgi:hypothetical protein